MHEASVAPPARAARRGGPEVLAEALVASRADTLAIFAAYERAPCALQVPLRPELNPPLWELGHIGWFQEYWVARNRQRDAGVHADPDAARQPPHRAAADALYNSSLVPHDSRWQLELPDAAATREDLARQLDETLALLRRAQANDDALYFFRLALLHEDMHHEAALYMARGLGIAVDDARWRARVLPEPPRPLAVAACDWQLGSRPGDGFAFDNELPGCATPLASYAIDAQVVRWAEFLSFVDAGGYEDARWWTDAGNCWREARSERRPRHVRRAAGGWEQWLGGRWCALDVREPAGHLTWHEARAWCRWAGRRLPSEAEWECAACSAPDDFRWGDVWEWTASRFAPFDGFVPHPYRDYSAPWFDGRPVLKGASHCTQPRLRHPRYRNFFAAERSDVPAGFRSCAL